MRLCSSKRSLKKRGKSRESSLRKLNWPSSGSWKNSERKLRVHRVRMIRYRHSSKNREKSIRRK